LQRAGQASGRGLPVEELSSWRGRSFNDNEKRMLDLPLAS